MTLPEIAVRRPVLALVVTLLLVLFGLVSFTRLSVREYPDIKPPIVSVRTVYPGGSAAIMETDVTTPLEDALSGVQGLRTVTSASREEVSIITVEFELGRDLDGAANDVRDRIATVRRLLPAGIEEPLVFKAAADNAEVLWVALSSDRHSELELSDVADRFIKSRLVMAPGVSTVYLDGERRYAMRIWLDPTRLAARRLTVQDVEDAIRAQHASIPSGRIESRQMEFGVSLQGALETPEEFGALIVASRDGYPIRLADVARVELGAEDTRRMGRLNGTASIGLSVSKLSKANALEVARAVKRELPGIAAGLPEGMALTVAWDGSLPIERSLREVYVALGFSLGLVVLVIFVFLGTARATCVPAAAIPASIIGAFTVLAATGCSLNVLTLLGLVLAVGLVVDDAIIMLENIHRRIAAGATPRQAALDGSREIAFAVVSTTVSLVTVFVPIAFLTGVVGKLFSELAIAVASAVLLSGFVALTLTPMMCAALLRHETEASVWVRGPAWVSERLVTGYRRILARVVGARVAAVVVGVGLSMGSVALVERLPSELAPFEDVGWFSGHLLAPQGATIRYTDAAARELESLIRLVPEADLVYTAVARGEGRTLVNRAASWVTLRDWDDRNRSQQAIVADLNRELGRLTGVKAYVLNPPPIDQWSDKPPLQFVLGGVDYQELREAADRVLAKLAAHPGFVAPDTDLALNAPHVTVEVQRDKAADLGVSVDTIGRTLETLLSGRSVGTFARNGRQYKVIVKIDDRYRETASDIGNLFVRGNDGELAQLRNMASVRDTSAPESLNHVDRMRAVTISAGLAEGFALGDALAYVEAAARAVVTPRIRITYGGESKTYAESHTHLSITFGLALAVITLVLSAQFESFRHPFTILLAVPSAVFGAVLALAAAGGTLSIYSQIGLVIVIGLVTKNAILIVEFANQLRIRGWAVGDAVIEAAALRLRPILMTTAATILGALPLALAVGAGAAGRRQIGVVLIGGLAVSTVVTLFLVPVAYVAISGLHQAPHEDAAQ